MATVGDFLIERLGEWGDAQGRRASGPVLVNSITGVPARIFPRDHAETDATPTQRT